MEQPDILDDEWIVVRFGLMELAHVRKAIQKANLMGNGFELSFFGGTDPEEIARIAMAPQGKMRLSTVGRLRASGFDVYRDEPPEGHLGLRWTGMPDDKELEDLISLFEEPVENPHPL